MILRKPSGMRTLINNLTKHFKIVAYFGTPRKLTNWSREPQYGGSVRCLECLEFGHVEKIRILFFIRAL